MTFYQCDVEIYNFGFPALFDDHMEKIRRIQNHTNMLNNCKNADYQVYFHHAMNRNISFNFAVRQNAFDYCVVSKLLVELEIEPSSVHVKEITREIYIKTLRDCYGADQSSGNELIEGLSGKIDLFEKYEPAVKEATKLNLIQQAKDLMYNDTLVPEIERIYASTYINAEKGNPIHYFIKENDIETGKAIMRLLLHALLNNHRLPSKRNLTIEIDGKHWTHQDHTQTLRILSGGAASVICHKESSDKRNSFETVKEMAEMLDKYNREIIFIFLMPENSRTDEKLMDQNVCGVSFVTITGDALTMPEDLPFEAEIHEYIRKIAKDTNIPLSTDLEGLFDMIEYGKEYHRKDLETMFDCWNNNRLKTEVYTEYTELENTCEPSAADEAPEHGSAYQELMAMIGLADAKAVINQALDYFTVQKLCKDKGIKQDHPAMHLMFTGNPGTAKTTVARLFARILHERVVIENGRLHEVGRADLIARYIGHTAPLVKQAFEKASGGVLFIDEAYSLLDDRGGSFGDEAITTIVQEMENHKDDTIVIFAGYPDKMEEFIERNPGLRSRINFHVPFKDYSIDELYAIAELMAEKQSITFADGVKEKLLSILEKGMKQTGFGNGRFVRNLFDQARMRQASRIVKKGTASATDTDLTTLIADDFDITQNIKRVQRIGFCADELYAK